MMTEKNWRSKGLDRCVLMIESRGSVKYICYTVCNQTRRGCRKA